MIRLGIKGSQKGKEVRKYLDEHPDVKHIIVFSPKNEARYFPDSGGLEFEHYGWDDIIMYKVFYPLLEKIDNSYLIVVNELMRTRNRYELTYNCMHHYLNQTTHKLVFQWFPIMDEQDDFMILLDFEHPGRFKGQGFSLDLLDGIDITGHDMRPSISIINVDVSEKEKSAYLEESEKLFANLGAKDPDTIPRQMELWVGKIKKRCLLADRLYVARNKRFAMPNVQSIKDAINDGQGGILIDMPHDRKTLNDLLYWSEMEKLEFMATPLSIDNYYCGQLEEWNRKAGDIYAKAGIH